jgi:hypothetical protein
MNRNGATARESATRMARRLWENSGADDWSNTARQNFEQVVRSTGRFMGDRPGVCLAVGLFLGMVSGWVIKLR